MATILFPLPDRDFEPTEAALPWRALRQAGHEVVFATPSGEAAACDPLALRGVLFGRIGARAEHADVYREMLEDPAFAHPIRYEAIDVATCDAVHLTGGHAPGMRAYLESPVLHECMRRALARGLVVSAICHGPVVLARAVADDGRPVLHGRRITALTKSMERTAWWLTRWTLGDHFRTYPQYVQDEVSAALGPDGAFEVGPRLPSYARPFVVCDDNLLTGRWPGDAELLARELVAML